MRRPAPEVRLDAAAATAEVVDLLDEGGFESRAADERVPIRRCTTAG